MLNSAESGWIGACLLRKEDARHLAGKGSFVGDIRLPGMRDVAFVRSTVAHAHLREVTRPENYEGRVFLYEDLGDVTPLRAGPEIASFKEGIYTPLATDRVRFVGQPIAACLARTRAEAEDLCEQVIVDLEELSPVVDPVAAMDPDSTRLFEHWPDNSFITATVSEGDASVLDGAKYKVRRQYKMNRQASNALECRGIVAWWDHRMDELVIYMTTQGAHIIRWGFARFLNIPENKIRVIAPDIGGGFGGKNRLPPEELAVAALALKLKTPVRWIEDRREHLTASVHARDHFYDVTIHADEDGHILGLTGDLYVDAGAYALWPAGAFMESMMSTRNLPGPYQLKYLSIRSFTVATNKPPHGPYRGVARPGACFCIERAVDDLAFEMGREPADIRALNLVRSDQMPYRTVAGLGLDTGDYPAALQTVRDMIDLDAVRKRQEAGEPDGRVIGVGFGIYTEQSGHGAAEWTKRKSQLTPGYESATVRLLPDGTLYIYVGIQSHGQGLETTLAQVAAQELGLHPDHVSVRYGDTSVSPYGFGTFGSRSMVFAGGAVARACRELGEKVLRIGAHLLQIKPEDARLESGNVVGPGGSVSFAEIGRIANIRQELLPEGEAPLLEITTTYEPKISSGVFSYGAHAALVAVDAETGVVEILDYVVAEDCGTIVNPMIVDGQIIGGIAQGIGTALYEELAFDPSGQPLNVNYGDYLMACAPEIPNIRLSHSVTPALVTEYGIKGMGEGGAIAPPAVLANALCDAFRSIGARFNETPLTPRRVSDAVHAAMHGGQS